ncbi:DMT family transporter [Actinoplanes philippinensis]|uniref:DMT family transporter n=1 Tax=Actinoplanes philippinensis TaxID=35752 RepID=UPI0033F346A8
MFISYFSSVFSSASAGARLSLLQVSAAGILWGTAGVVVQVVAGHTGLGALAIGFYRLAVAAVVLLVIGLPSRRRIWAAFRGAPAAVVAAGVGLAAYQGLYFVAVRLSGVSIATVVSLGIAPVLLSAWETLRTRQRPSTATMIASAAAIGGLVLIGGATAEPGATAGPGASAAGLGLLAAVGSGIVYAASTALSRHTTQGVEPLTLTTLSCAIGAIAILPIAAVEGLAFTPQAGPVALLIYAGAITTALAYALFYTGLRRISGSVAVVVTLLEPLTAALLAVLLIDEPLGLATMIGGLLLLGAVATLYLDADGTPEHPAPAPLPAGPIGTPPAGPKGTAAVGSMGTPAVGSTPGPGLLGADPATPDPADGNSAGTPIRG